MELRILGCYGGSLPGKNLTSLLIDGTILIDAGGATSALGLDELKAIESIVISHAHLDHICDLGMIGDLVIGPERDAVEIISIEPTCDAISDHIFNNKIWPDFTKIPTPDAPVFKMRTEQPRTPFKVGKYSFEFVMVNHPAPTVAMVIRDDKSTVIFTADTGETQEIWDVAKDEENLKGVITEISFPNALLDLSNMSGHFSPCQIDDELAKMGRDDVPVYIYHFKPAFEDTLREEMKAIKYPSIRPLEQGETLTFS